MRQLLYPMLLPAIVAIVWFSAWVKQVDDRISGSLFPPTVPSSARHFTGGTPGPAGSTDAVRSLDTTEAADAMATADDEALIEY